MGSYNHYCVLSPNQYPHKKYYIGWQVDHARKGKSHKEPRKFYRKVSEEAARRFCKKWGLNFPE